MSCDISAGRREICLNNIGGIKNAYIVNDSDFVIEDLSYDTNGVITGVANSPEAYKFELKATTNLADEVGTVSRDAGTNFYTSTLVLNLKKQDALTQNDIQELAAGAPRIMVQYNTGVVRLFGLEFGGDVAITTNSGGAIGDFQGYVITATFNEPLMAKFVDADLATVGFTIVEGTN